MMNTDAAFGAGGQHVFQTNVGKRTARHYSVVAATTAIAVEVFNINALLLQVVSGRTVGFNRPGRTDVVRRGRVAN